MLKAERKRAGLTQQQVANALGVPQSYVAKYEGGERRLDVLEFIAVVRAVGADPAEMLDKLLSLLGDRRQILPRSLID